jgi:hypothetical protein
VAFVLFLGYESARKAVEDLIEFQPTRAETRIVILLTELKCYAFLLEYFEHDQLRHSRLELRKESYMRIVPDLVRGVNSEYKNNDDWIHARRTIPELERRYKDAFGEEMTAAISRREREEQKKREEDQKRIKTHSHVDATS